MQTLQLSAEELDKLLAWDDRSETATAGRPDRRHGSEISVQRSALPEPVPHVLGAMELPALGLEELQHIALALDDARRYADNSVAAYFSKQLAKCATEDGAHGPRRTLPPVLGVITAIEECARQAKPPMRKNLLAVSARSAEFAGWLYRDIGAPAMAAYWRDRAVEWAQEAGDYTMQGYVLLRKSQAAWDERDAPRMLTLAQAAQEGPWRLPPKVKGEAAQQEARACAMLGDDLDQVERKLDEARQAIEDDPPAEDVPADVHLNDSYGGSLFAMQAAICYEEAGQPERAVDTYRTQLTLSSFSYRDYGYFLSLMAGALATAGEPDEASQTALDALTVAAATHSTRTNSELYRLADRLQPWANRPAVRNFYCALPAG